MKPPPVMGSNPFTDTLHVLSWNANGIFPRLEELRDFIILQDPDIILVQETRLPTSRRSLTIQNYNHYYTFRDSPTDPNVRSPHGGTAVYIKNHISHHPLPSLPTGTVEHTLIQVNIPTMPGLVIGSAYARHKTSTPIEDDLTLLFTKHDRLVLMGDFNAHHRSWNCARANKHGTGIYKFINDSDINISTPNSPTHYSNTGTPAIIDFALMGGINHSHSIYTHPALSSDHLPVSLHIKLNKPLPVAPRHSRTNWQHFSQHLNNSPLLIPNINSTADIDLAVNTLNSSIAQAFSKSTVPIPKPPPMRLPADIRALIKERNKLRCRWQHYKCPTLKTQLNALNREVRAKIHGYRNDRWTSTISALSTEDNSIWKFTRMLKGTPHFIPPLNTPTGPAYSVPKKAEALAEHFQNQFTPNQDIFDEDTIEEVNDTLKTFLNTPPPPVTDLIYPTDITNIITTLKTNKSPGQDKINNRMIKAFPINIIFYLTFIYNAMFKYSYFPKEWRVAVIAPIHKPGENPSNPGSYRPISLLSCIGKIGEKLIATKLNDFVEANDILPPEQFGFRHKHNTSHQLLRVVECSADSLSRKTSTGAIFFDISKAFDRVYQEGLIFKMIKLNFPIPLIFLIHSFLSNRKFSVKYNNTHSTFHPIIASVPQGSVLAPLLFNIYISDFPRSICTMTAFFADDTAILSTHKSLYEISKQLQFHVDLLEDWFQKWRIKLNATKSHYVLFTRKQIAPPPVYVNDTPLYAKSSTKYLGVTLDRGLTWKTHIDNVIKKYNMVKANISPLLYNNTITSQNKVLLAKTVLRPILLYACPVWGFAAKIHTNKLQVAESKTLRTIRNANCRYMSNVTIRNDLQVKTIKYEMKKLATKFFNNLPNVRNELLFNLDDYDPRHRRSRKRPRAALI